jgi:subtilase family serine protease
VPLYQAEYGLASLLSGGRGVPDVSALSAGDTQYAVLNSGYVNGTSNNLLAQSGGTSAAAPLWASLTLQFDAIFHDQHLPNLGFYNDLLYEAGLGSAGICDHVKCVCLQLRPIWCPASSYCTSNRLHIWRPVLQCR